MKAMMGQGTSYKVCSTSSGAVRIGRQAVLERQLIKMEKKIEVGAKALFKPRTDDLAICSENS